MNVVNLDLEDLISGADSTLPKHLTLNKLPLSFLIYKTKVITVPPFWVVLRIKKYNLVNPDS